MLQWKTIHLRKLKQHILVFMDTKLGWQVREMDLEELREVVKMIKTCLC